MPSGNRSDDRAGTTSVPGRALLREMNSPSGLLIVTLDRFGASRRSRSGLAPKSVSDERTRMTGRTNRVRVGTTVRVPSTPKATSRGIEPSSDSAKPVPATTTSSVPLHLRRRSARDKYCSVPQLCDRSGEVRNGNLQCGGRARRKAPAPVAR